MLTASAMLRAARGVFLALAARAAAAVTDYAVVVGYADSTFVSQFVLSGTTGALTPFASLDTGARGTAWIAASPDSRRLYVANDASVTVLAAAWLSGPAGGRAPPPTPALSVQSAAAAPASSTHVALDAAEGALYSVAYGAGSTWGYAVSAADGSLGAATPSTPICTKAHQAIVVPADARCAPGAGGRACRTVIIPCLGDDSIVLARAGGDCSSPVGGVCYAIAGASRPTSGPRHAVAHPRLPLLYVLNELDSSVATWQFNATALTLTSPVYISSLPPGTPLAGNASVWSAAEIALNGDASVLYASNRPLVAGAPSSIGAWALDPATGALGAAIGWAGTQPGSGLAFPRHYSLTPDGAFLLAANQRGASVTVFRVAPGGALQELATVPTPDGAQPAYVAALQAPPAQPQASGERARARGRGGAAAPLLGLLVAAAAAAAAAVAAVTGLR